MDKRIADFDLIRRLFELGKRRLTAVAIAVEEAALRVQQIPLICRDCRLLWLLVLLAGLFLLALVLGSGFGICLLV